MCWKNQRFFKDALKRVLIFLIPIIALPVFAFGDTKEIKCAYGMVIVILYWVSEAIPLSATALLPVVLFPLLDVIGTSTICKAYMKTTTMIALGGLFLAVAIEASNIHKRLALKLLVLVGINNQRLMPSFLITASVLSMWISNTTTALILVPILEAVSAEIVQQEESIPEDASNFISNQNRGVFLEKTNDNEIRRNITSLNLKTPIQKGKTNSLKTALLLAIAYGANVGGTGTLTGTGPNLVLKGIMEDLYEESQDITYASWMLFGIPCAVLCTFISWLVLHFTFVRKSPIVETVDGRSIGEIVRSKYEELGPISFQEGSVLGIFILMKLLWFFEEPRFMTGWGELLVKEEKLGGATVVIAMTSLLFIIPADPKRFWTGPALLDWKSSQKKMHWGIVLILGGGFALAEAFKYSGLSRLVSEVLSLTSGLSGPALILIMCLLTATLTEFTSNVVTATVFLPVMAELSLSIGTHPLYLMLPVTISSSFSFMLPVATPPNTVVCEVGNIGAKDMLFPGLIMNILCCITTLALTLTLGVYVFDLHNQPIWAYPVINATETLT